MTDEAFLKIFNEHRAETRQLKEENRRLSYTLAHKAKTLAWWEDLFQGKSRLDVERLAGRATL